MAGEREVDAVGAAGDLAPGAHPPTLVALRDDPDPVAVLRRGDGAPKIAYINPALLRITALDAEHLVGRAPAALLADGQHLDVHPDTLHGTSVNLRDVNGRRHRCRVSAWHLADELIALRLVPSDLDLTDQSFGSLIGALVNHAVAVDRHGRVLTGTPDWTTAFAERPAEIDDLLLWLEEHGSLDPRYIDAHHALRDVLHRHSTMRAVDLPTPDERWLSVTITGVDDAGGVAAMISIIDVTDRKRRESDLAERMLTDPLTSLPNRSLTLDRLHHALTHNPRAHEGVAVLFVDLDGFGDVNDRLGHLAADELLADVARTLRHAVRPSDTVGRWGGDEFVVICDRLHHLDETIPIANRIIRHLRQLGTVRHGVNISASIGISYSTDGSAGARELLQDADTAMYAAKARGGSEVEVFTAEDRERERLRLGAAQELRRGILADQLTLEFQPQADLLTGRILSMEALVRWRRPDGTLLLPGEFLSMTNQDDTISLVDRWVLKSACEQLTAWRIAGHRVLLSVNVSTRELSDSGFVDRLDDALLTTGADPSALTIEITEDALLDRDVALVHLPEVSRRGVRVALDDFGAGYGPLSSLGTASIDTIKLDPSLIEAIDEPTGSYAVVRGLIRMAAELGIEVVAEGVERRSQLIELRRIACPMVQGFLLGRPTAPDATPALDAVLPAIIDLNESVSAVAGW
ncbi:MAG: EAL domain-containing protein [Actinomycetota bacterium]